MHSRFDRSLTIETFLRVAAVALMALALMIIGNKSQAALRDITSTFALEQALDAAEPGDVLRLAPGKYGTLSLGRVYGTQTRPVTLTSADPKNPAMFRNLIANGAEGISLSHLVFDYTFRDGDNVGKLRVSQINKSRNIVIAHAVFAGDRAFGSGPSANGLGAGQGLIIRGAQDIRIEDSEFHTWYRGLVVSQSSGIAVQGNAFHSIRSDGADFAEVSDVTIANNHFYDFDRGEDAGDHADMIQFWTNGTQNPTHKITIKNNVFNSGLGLWTQSIFMRNELVDSQGAGDEMFYRDITITENVIVNAHLHGITVGETDGLTITRNTLVHNPRSIGKDGSAALWTPSIRVAGKSRNVHIAQNIVPKISLPEPLPAWTVEDNMLIQNVEPTKTGYYDNVFVAARHGDPSSLASFTYLPGSPGAQGLVGATQLRGDVSGNASSALFQVTRDPRFVNRFTFDASLSQGMEKDMLWKFSDGTEASGTIVTHDFSTPGQFTVELTIDSAGSELHTSARVEVPTFDILSFNPTTGTVLVQGQEYPTALQHNSVRRLADGRHVITIGHGKDAVPIDKSAIAGFFGTNDISLDIRLRTTESRSPAGEILRIHNNLILSMTSTGGIDFWLSTSETSKPVIISTSPLQLHDGTWHDVGLRYNATDGIMAILVDGVLRNQKKIRGKIRPMESWGLFLGNPYGKKSFDGDIAELALRANVESFTKP